MNKDRYLEMLKKTDFVLSKESVNTSIFLALCANIAVYFLFKNIIATIILAIVFIVCTIVLLRNRWYLPEHYNSLLVKSVIGGHWFLNLSVSLVLFQIKMNIVFWFYVLEVILLVFMVFCVIRAQNKAMKKSDYTLEVDKIDKMPKYGASAGFAAYTLASLISMPFVESFAWHFLSTFFFGIVLIAEFIFVGALLTFLGYIKYVDE